jgi:drug/metabolite transporter superfamily protein YnfA
MIISILILVGGILLAVCGGFVKTRNAGIACCVIGGLLIVVSLAFIFFLKVILSGMRIE